jgi:RNA polymerase sigma-70 factor (ECF subfamily)
MVFRDFYDRHVRFVWRSLLRIGVPESELADAVQDVFLVVHRKLDEFEGRSSETTWLFGICLRVASDRRALAHKRREVPAVDAAMTHHTEADAPALADRRRASEMLRAILDRMPEEQRIVFSLFEFESMTGEEIAELLGLPVGTVRSRLRLARDEFQRCVARLQAREHTQPSGVLRAREA